MKEKILFINGHLNPGGVERALVDILRSFDYSKYEVDLVLLEALGAYQPELPEKVKVRLIDLHNTYGNLLKVVLKCVAEHDWLCLKMRLLFLLCKYTDNRMLKHAKPWLFRDVQYDAVVGFRPGISTDLAAFAVNSKKKLTWWHHGEYSLNGREEQNYRLACAQMDKIISVSEGCADFLKEHLPEYADRIDVIPNIVPSEDIKRKAELFHCSTDSSFKQIVSVCRLSPEKHVENCVYAAQQIFTHGCTNFRWTIVGDGPERENLERMVADSGLKDHVVFVGMQGNPYPFVRQADLFVHPSYVESQGLVVLEAMALGIPCVVTKSIGPSEFIVDGVNGVFAEQSKESLADKVKAILLNDTLYAKIRENIVVPAQYDAKCVQEKLETVLRD